MAHIEITTSIGCPPSCSICPQRNLVQAYAKSDKYAQQRMMTFELFRKCLDNTPAHYEVAFSGMSEPFANPNCLEMIQYAIDRGRQIHLFSTLIGLSADDATVLALLINKGLIKRTVIHLPDAHGTMNGFVISDEYIRNLLLLLPLQNVSSMCMSANSSVDPSVINAIRQSPGAKYVYRKLPRVPFIANSRAGNIKNSFVSSSHLKEKLAGNLAVTCSKTPFYDEPVLLPDGSLVLCCQDYGLKHCLGNLSESSYDEIRSSREFNQILLVNGQPTRPDSPQTLCNECEYADHWYHTNGKWVKLSSNHPISFFLFIRQKLVTAKKFLILAIKSF